MVSAPVLVSPLLEVVSEKLKSLIRDKFGDLWGVQKEMKKFSKTLSSIKYFLTDAEEKQVAIEEIRDWLKQLKDAAYTADDFLEEWAFLDQQLAPHKVTDSLKDLMESFDELAEDMLEFGLERGMVQKRAETCLNRETGAALTEPKVYGRDEDKHRLVNLLLNPYRRSSKCSHPRAPMQKLDQVNNQENIFVCSIWGMGGIGKTTLAQLVYSDQRVVDHFQSRSWVCVSDDFDVTRLIKLIIDFDSLYPCNQGALAPLQQLLQKELRDKRFFLVLDDVWDDNQDKWEILKGSLACGAKGSCVLVTTRHKNVASIASPFHPYRLDFLSNEDCWLLFKQRAFSLQNVERPSLVQIGKQIVAKCGGVPLAAKAMGGLLRFETKESVWSSIRDSEIWELPQHHENNMLQVLTLSYDHLSSLLKQCFIYCSIFPRSHCIHIKELILMWMANDFLQPKGRMELEDVGIEVFNELLWRSFFQEIEKDEYGNIITCKMHHIVHDLARYMSANECSALDVGSEVAGSVGNITEGTRHMSLFCSEEPKSFIPGSIETGSPFLRSFIWLDDYMLTAREKYTSFFFRLMRLRALDLHKCQIEVVPDCIGEMIHLRYLNLSFNLIQSLPECICGLKYLQTLNVSRCSKLQSLPNHMSQMINLRHLDIQGCGELRNTPVNIGKLTRLHTLSIFIVGLENGCSIKELQQMNQLGGELKIKRLEHVQNSVESREANLKSKKNLHSLGLSWSESLEVNDNATDVIEALHPHLNLSRLFVEGCEGVTFPSWLTVSSVPNLVKINLSKCRGWERLPPLGKLPLLKVLKMDSMDSVKFIDDEVYEESEVKGFPSLEELSLSKMPNLESWSSSLQAAATQQLVLPRLKRWTLSECPRQTERVPLSSSLRYALITECNETAQLGSVGDLPLLSELHIWDSDELENFPEGMLRNLANLEKLSIHGCTKLEALPVEMESLTKLTALWIQSCGELVSLGEGEGVLRKFSSLKILCILNCPMLKCFPKLHESSLEILYILDCPELEFSTEDFEDLVDLQILRLWDLPKLSGGFPKGLKQATLLESLSIMGCCSGNDEMDLPEWIGTLTSLMFLHIEGCKNRKVLPEGLQNLTALRELEIYGCNKELERRCEKDKGEDWFKIAHIPYVIVTSKPRDSY